MKLFVVSDQLQKTAVKLFATAKVSLKLGTKKGPFWRKI